MPDGERTHSRRAYDDVIPVVMLQVEEKLKQTRHDLRNEIALMATNIQTGQIKASQEHEAVRSDIADLKRCVDELVPLKTTVGALRDHDIADQARDLAIDELKKTIRNGILLLVAVVGAVNGLVAVLVN